MEVRHYISIIAIIVVMLTAAFSLNRYTKREEYRELMASGQKINLNIVSLLMGFARRKTDPLRKAHVRIAKIGLLHFTAMLFGMFFVPFMIAAISVAIEEL